ncbi:hypothetical protein AVEN_225743-1 [Araneus ventricosus]|uniref:Uncharacterized protein n=1 Tax=Araneus ventricosus TaxID=182803 RepID=A0A4Y2FWV4_ARAVE|nr:hypothetical protein AVEN_225743-1 [Araneus ventricosus]
MERDGMVKAFFGDHSLATWLILRIKIPENAISSIFLLKGEIQFFRNSMARHGRGDIKRPRLDHGRLIDRNDFRVSCPQCWKAGDYAIESAVTCHY